MATAQEIRQQITSVQEELERQYTSGQALDAEIAEALERQRLRRLLGSLEVEEHSVLLDNQCKRDKKKAIDEDRHFINESQRPLTAFSNPTSSVINCSQDVCCGEYTWRIEGMSWLVNALQQCGEEFAEIPECFTVGNEEFDIVYHPCRGLISRSRQLSASLAIRHWGTDGITFRYKMFIRRRDGELLQWGETGDECNPNEDSNAKLFGPDVQGAERPGKPAGIFGLSHEELITSEWVHQDALTVKVVLEVRPSTGSALPLKKAQVDVPPATLCTDMLSLLEEGNWSDVSFLVKGELVKAHTLVLSARSEVFAKQLHSGMRESLSKEVVIEDCEPSIFRAMLRFLYTDDFVHVEALLKKSEARKGVDTESAGPVLGIIGMLQGLLAVSHKYDLTRLHLWCEQQLCERITHEEVCSLLCQAHLFNAKQLEEVCLNFIRTNARRVVGTLEFARLTTEWPEVLLKISLFGLGVSPANAEPAVLAQLESRRKRKRE